MHPILLRIIVVGVGGWILKEMFSSNQDEKMGADAHDYFLQFEHAISVPKSKVKKLIASRKALQNRIVDFFRAKGNVPIPKFYIQGSYKMETMVLTKDGTYDVDLGVYFLIKPRVEPSTLQKWVAEALVGQTVGGIQHRRKCIRVIYQGDFDIDLPVYYKSPSDKHPYLAAKNDWIESDPKELCDWFESRIDEREQMLRLVKYFKVWASNKSGKMPSGIAFSVWVANHYKTNSRDDIAFHETAKAIKESFWWSVSCENPATPNDDLVAKLTGDQKSAFEDELSKLIENCETALKKTKLTDATRSWKRIFGDRFPIAQ